MFGEEAGMAGWVSMAEALGRRVCRDLLADRVELPLVPSLEFDPSIESVGRLAAQLARTRRRGRGWLERRRPRSGSRSPPMSPMWSRSPTRPRSTDLRPQRARPRVINTGFAFDGVCASTTTMILGLSGHSGRGDLAAIIARRCPA
jgi:hypothetical protein